MKKSILILMAAILTVSLLISLCSCSDNAAKTTYPEKPVNMIIAFTAGGSSDVQARIVEKYWKDNFNNQPLVFDYKTGAGGQVGFTEITKAAPDGYTIGGINVPHIVLQALSSSATFKIEDFAYIAQVVKDPLLLAVKSDSSIDSLREFIDEAKKMGGKMNIGIVGPFTAHHIGILQLADLLGVELNPVIFKGSADQNVALLGGHVDAMLGNLNDVMRDLAGFKILALADDERHPWIKDTPTFKELNVNFVADIRRGFAGPKDLAPNVLQHLRDGFKNICNDSEYLKEMEKIGQPSSYLSGEDFEKYVFDYAETAQTIIEKYGLK